MGCQIAPMIDVVFVIMLFFMVMAGAVKVERELKTSLPGLAPPNLDKPQEMPDEIVVTVEETGVVTLNEEEFDTPESKDLPNFTSTPALLKQEADKRGTKGIATIEAAEQAKDARGSGADAADGIRQHLQQAYAADGGIDEATRARLEVAIAEVTDIWLRNVWPERKLGWNAYPDLATHYGCFRCHDGQHRSPGGRVVFGPSLQPGGVPIRDGSCDRCHVVLSENEEDPAVLEAFGLKR